MKSTGTGTGTHQPIDYRTYLTTLSFMIKEQTALPRLIELGADRIERLADILEPHGVDFTRSLILSDENTAHIAGDAVASALRAAATAIDRHCVANSDGRNVRDVMAEIQQRRPDLVIGVGGGKVLDVAKLAAGNTGRTFIAIPTALSNDGIASPVAVIRDRKNIPVSHITRPPVAVIIDIEIVRRAPRRHLLAGVGDLISNLSAVADARLGHEQKGEPISEHALDLAEAGPTRLLTLANPALADPGFLQELAQGLVRSGLAMCLHGTSRPASGSEHKISHAIDHLFPTGAGLHGEQVGIAALVTMALQRNEQLAKVKDFYKKIGFPVKLRHLGLDRAGLVKAVQRAARSRRDRFTVLEALRPDRRAIEAVIAELAL